MAYATPQHSRTKVDAAADFLAHDFNALIAQKKFDITAADRFDHAFDIVGNWRSSHSWPMLSIRFALMDRAGRIASHGLISQRLKRFPAIFVKLRRFKHMKLSQMQDIGGCRAVLPSVRMVERLDESYKIG